MKKWMKGIAIFLLIICFSAAEPVMALAEESGSENVEDSQEDPKENPIEDPQEDSKEDPKEDPQEDPKEDPKESTIGVSYSAHVQNIGWMSDVTDGMTAGTTGRSLRLEALKLSLTGVDPSELGISYRSHVENVGWQNEVTDGAITGTTGESKQMEAIAVQLTGSLASQYHVYYRVHVQNVGWMDWAVDGEESGSSGLKIGIEAIEIKILKDGDASAPDTGSGITFINSADFHVNYSTMTNGAFTGFVSDGATGGTTGQNLPIAGFESYVDTPAHIAVQGGIQYSTHVANIGWTNYRSDGDMSYYTGANQRIEAFKIQLTGNIAGFFDVYYRVHVQNIGWLGWTMNGGLAGSEGYGYQAEAIEMQLVPKCSAIHPTLGTAYKKKLTTKLLGEFSTVSQNTANGTYNMSRALSMFNGITIQPGQTLSFNATTGYCGAANGYKIAGVVGGSGYGGGVCQASTTLYGAAIRAGLTIVERNNHSVKSVYVPVGLDAMINYGSSDLKIKNPYSTPVTIKTWTEGKTLHVQIYGTDQGWWDSISAVSWATSSVDAAACRIYYKNGVEVKREALPSSHYRR